MVDIQTTWKGEDTEARPGQKHTETGPSAIITTVLDWMCKIIKRGNI
jgi:hypothetical protein